MTILRTLADHWHTLAALGVLVIGLGPGGRAIYRRNQPPRDYHDRGDQ